MRRKLGSVKASNKLGHLQEDAVQSLVPGAKLEFAEVEQQYTRPVDLALRERRCRRGCAMRGHGRVLSDVGDETVSAQADPAGVDRPSFSPPIDVMRYHDANVTHHG